MVIAIENYQRINTYKFHPKHKLDIKTLRNSLYKDLLNYNKKNLLERLRTPNTLCFSTAATPLFFMHSSIFNLALITQYLSKKVKSGSSNLSCIIIDTANLEQPVERKINLLGRDFHLPYKNKKCRLNPNNIPPPSKIDIDKFNWNLISTAKSIMKLTKVKALTNNKTSNLFAISSDILLLNNIIKFAQLIKKSSYAANNYQDFLENICIETVRKLLPDTIIIPSKAMQNTNSIAYKKYGLNLWTTLKYPLPKYKYSNLIPAYMFCKNCNLNHNVTLKNHKLYYFCSNLNKEFQYTNDINLFPKHALTYAIEFLFYGFIPVTSKNYTADIETCANSLLKKYYSTKYNMPIIKAKRFKINGIFGSSEIPNAILEGLDTTLLEKNIAFKKSIKTNLAKKYKIYELQRYKETRNKHT